MKTIISRCPWAIRVDRATYFPVKTFDLPAAPFDGFVRLKITDQQESVYIGAGYHRPAVVPADELAQDIVREVGLFTCGDSGALGVFVHEKDDPSDAEVLASPQYAAAGAAQDQIFRNLVIEARILKANPLTERSISAKHHTAAAYLNIEGETWMNHDMHRSARKVCQFCAAFVAASVVKCPTCSEIIDAAGYARQRAAIQQQVDAIERQTGAAKTSAPAKKELVPA